MDLGLRDAAAVVAGGSRGMGRATAELLAAEGCRMAVLARSEPDLREAEEGLRAKGAPDVLALRADLLVAADVEAAFATVGRRWGALNALVCAAGPTSAGTLEELSDAYWLHAFDEGVLGAVRCVRAALPLLRKARFARIVTLGATSTRHQNPRLIGYTAAKAALVSVSKNLARSLAPEGMVVNCVCPGWVLTPSVAAHLRARWRRRRGSTPTTWRARIASARRATGRRTTWAALAGPRRSRWWPRCCAPRSRASRSARPSRSMAGRTSSRRTRRAGRSWSPSPARRRRARGPGTRARSPRACAGTCCRDGGS